MVAFIPFLIGLMARAAGGGVIAKHLPSWLTWLPELLIACALGWAGYMLYGPVWAAVTTPIAFFGIERGHAAAYHMGRNPTAALKRKHTLSYVVDPICRLLKWPLGERKYCYLFMGIKGLLVAAPIMPIGILMAVLWPVAYDIGRHRNNETAEFLSGLLLGGVLLLAILTG